MIDIFDSLEKKKAFKKALQEVKQEDSAKYKNTVSRVYGESEQTARYNGPLSKPATDVVDLKHFKNWRKVDKVESNNPVYDSNLFDSPLKKSEPEQQTKAKPVFKSSPVSNYVSKPANQDRKTSSDFDDFFAKRNISASEKVEEKKKTFSDSDVEKAKNTFSRMFEDVEKKRQAKIAAEKELEEDKAELDLILAKMKDKKSEQKLPEVKVEVEQAKKEETKPVVVNVRENDTPKTIVTSSNNSEPVRVEIKLHTEPRVAPAPVQKPAVAPKKKVTNRKPRGKNKRRFDADVIGSVDWR